MTLDEVIDYINTKFTKTDYLGYHRQSTASYKFLPPDDGDRYSIVVCFIEYTDNLSYSGEYDVNRYSNVIVTGTIDSVRHHVSIDPTLNEIIMIGSFTTNYPEIDYIDDSFIINTCDDIGYVEIVKC